MSKLTQAQKEQLKRCVIDCIVRRLTLIDTQQYVKQKMHVEISTEYIRHLRSSLKHDLENQLKTYAIDRTAYIDEMVFKRMAELEDNQTILRNIIDNNEDNPEAQIKAVAELNETTVLIANLFELLPQITRLGVDASPSVFQQTQTQTQTGKNDNSLLSGSGSGGGQGRNNYDYIEWCKSNNPKHPNSCDCRWDEYKV
jgi:hypothetical protein